MLPPCCASPPQMSVNNYAIITFLKENRDKELPVEEVEVGAGVRNLSTSPQLLHSLKENRSINYREDTSSGGAISHA